MKHLPVAHRTSAFAEPHGACRELSALDHNGQITIVEVGDTPFVITPDVARVLLRIMRKAAERRRIDLGVTPARDDDRP